MNEYLNKLIYIALKMRLEVGLSCFSLCHTPPPLFFLATSLLVLGPHRLIFYFCVNSLLIGPIRSAFFISSFTLQMLTFSSPLLISKSNSFMTERQEEVCQLQEMTQNVGRSFTFLHTRTSGGKQGYRKGKSPALRTTEQRMSSCYKQK